MEQLTDNIHQACAHKGLSYDGTKPLCVSPGVFLFNATTCTKSGACREQKYTYISLGDEGYINE